LSYSKVNVIAYFLLFFAALVVFLAILAIAATMLSSSISDAEDRYESMQVDAPPVGIAATQIRSEANQAAVFSSAISDARDPESF
jgi:hypothetical protein